MKPLIAFAAFMVLAAGGFAAPVQDSTILLWPDGAPHAEGTDVIDQPAITVHLPPKDIATGAAIVVNPGGGYRILAADHEGLQVARWLNRIGVAAFVLRYRVMPKYPQNISLLDAQRAIRCVRANAGDFGISPDRIGMLGFSAGGHLTTAAGTQFDDGDPNAADPVERVSCRPDFIVPVYPAISGVLFNRPDEYRPTNELVTEKTPPTFLVQSHEDTLVVPTHSVMFYEALLKAKVPAEFHVFGYGAHGMGLGSGDPEFAQWTDLLHTWLRRSKFLTSAQRIAIEGTATIDGEPISFGWVTFIPDDKNAPAARVFITGRSKDGNFSIDREHGPVPGRHRVEIYRNTLISPMNNRGEYSLEDVQKFIQLSPNDGGSLIVDLPAEQPLKFDVRSK